MDSLVVQLLRVSQAGVGYLADGGGRIWELAQFHRMAFCLESCNRHGGLRRLCSLAISFKQNKASSSHIHR